MKSFAFTLLVLLGAYELNPVDAQLSTLMKNVANELKHPKDFIDKVAKGFEHETAKRAASSTAVDSIASSSSSSSTASEHDVASLSYSATNPGYGVSSLSYSSTGPDHGVKVLTYSSTAGNADSSSTGINKPKGPRFIPSNHTSTANNTNAKVPTSGVPKTNVVNGSIKLNYKQHNNTQGTTKDHKQHHGGQKLNNTHSQQVKKSMNSTWVQQVIDNKEYSLDHPGQQALDAALFFDHCQDTSQGVHAYINWMPNTKNNQTSLLNYNFCISPSLQPRLITNLVMINQANPFGSKSFVSRVSLCGSGSLGGQPCDTRDSKNIQCNQGFALLPLPFDPLATNTKIELRTAPPATSQLTLCL